jgi:hypothetical protein
MFFVLSFMDENCKVGRFARGVVIANFVVAAAMVAVVLALSALFW